MIDYNPVTKESGNCFVVGRGSIAIELVLSRFDRGKVLIPVNICYAAVLPILYSRLEPLFCDVDRYTGNVTLESIKNVCTDDVVAAVIPHMYGNPVESFKDIIQFCHNKNIIVIEDCASLMTNCGNEYIPGTLGDYVVYSTGYSKTIDLGHGGLLFSSKCNLEELEQTADSYPILNGKMAREWDTFSKIYRTIRNQGTDTNIAKFLYGNLDKIMKDSFYFSLENGEKDRIVFEIEKQLDDVMSIRKQKNMLFVDFVTNERIKKYVFLDDAIPWRFNLYIENRNDFVRYCLNNSLPVSDWYPTINRMFGDDHRYPEAEWHGDRIVNFPLLIPDSQIYRIADVINNYRENTI